MRQAGRKCIAAVRTCLTLVAGGFRSGRHTLRQFHVVYRARHVPSADNGLHFPGRRLGRHRGFRPALVRAALKELLIGVALIVVLRLKPPGVLPERIPPAPRTA